MRDLKNIYILGNIKGESIIQQDFDQRLDTWLQVSCGKGTGIMNKARTDGIPHGLTISTFRAGLRRSLGIKECRREGKRSGYK